ncbi:non-ribosomal peptide synthetase [Pseudomonas fontis]|uniref:Amino acid adenylation domain-containing protein n=1 Tax=Pseudomonas fontis TaxID=2942633 RepID=A0ABT5NXZ7_9PSED|nr:non-ribosomal peptide synthetase [Pseudomonas fontis]MDD0972508.1 amino acid adenylation domain-containing protein [Pseudomonas fontis]MDD0993032.1 amino acid adenylation domain-containing protein [Pseudomonas fontis]
MREFNANRYQRRFFLEWQLAPQSTLYNTPLVYRIEGDLDEQALECALAYFVNHYYHGCRSRFRVAGDELLQQVAAPIAEVLCVREVALAQTLDEAIGEALAIPFNLESGPLFRFSLLRREQQRVLLLNFHHIIADATSALHFVHVLEQSYQHYLSGTPLPEPSTQLPAMDDSTRQADVDYWCERLAGQPLSVELPRQEVPAAPAGLGSSHYFELSPALSQALRKYARSQRATPFMVIAAAVGQVVAGYAGADSLVLNYPVDMRPAGARQVLGCYINNYPLHLDVGAQCTLDQQVAHLLEQRKAAREHGRFTLTEVIRQLRNSERSEERPFNVSVIEAYFGEDQLALGKARLHPLPLGQRQVVGDLVFAYQQDAERIRLRLDYQLGLFSAAFIQRLAASFVQLLECALDAPQQPLHSGWLLTAPVYQQLRAFAGEPAGVARGQQGVMAMFMAQVKCQPDAPALHYRNATLSYRQLASAASAVAAQLHSAHPTPRRIGICLQRKDLAVVAMLGILGSGNAYVPIDPHMPLERLRDIVSDSGMDLLICDQALPIDVKQWCLAPTLVRAPTCPVALSLPPASALAYLIYTSGSTGRPKGVCIEQAALGHLIADFVTDLQLDSRDRVVGATAVGFDIFGLELFGALASGARLLLLDEQLQDPAALCTALDAYQPTLLQGTPSFWSILALAGWRPAERGQARLLCGGEALSKHLAEYLLACSTRVLQVYGPTETTIWSTRKVLSDPAQHAVIGQPIGATCCYVLDPQQNLVPWGANGELYIGGVGLSSGYHQREALNAERFVMLDALARKGETVRLYRTGDRVRWNEHGELVYLGRLDFQVKVRGHRVELGEIEHALHQLPGIRQAVVLAWEHNGQTELSAYVVPRSPEAAEPAAWRAALHEHLPGYMVPRHFQCLDQLPRSLNGKVDRQALERPTQDQSAESVAAKNPLESKLLGLWQNLLNVPVVSTQASFFELGGHSLLAAQLLIGIHEHFGVRLSLAQLLCYPSVGELAAYVGSCSTEEVTEPQRETRFPLSLEQQHLYFSDRYDEGQVQRFNLAVVQRLEGAIDLPALQRAWEQVVRRHDQLHMQVVDDQGLWQVYSPQTVHPIQRMQVAADALQAYLEDALRQPLDLHQAPLVQVQLLRLNEREHILLLRLPHLIADGWSLDLLRRQLGEAYNAECQGDALNWPPVSQSYSGAVTRQQRWLASAEFEQARDYWRSLLEGYEGLDLPSDGHDAGSSAGAHHYFSLPAHLVKRLTQYCEQHAASLFSGLFSVFALLLRRYCEQNDLVISVPSANRAAGNEAVFGLFTCTLPLRVQIDEQAPFAALLEQVALLGRQAQAHQGVPLEAMQALQPGTQGQSHALMQAVFALQSANEQHALDLHGLHSEFLEVEDGIARYPLFLSLRHDASGGLRGTLEYATERFSAARMARLGEHYCQLLEHALDSDASVAQLELLTPIERQALLARGEPEAPSPDSLVSLFARTSTQFPCAIAVQDGPRSLTYSELDQASTALAQHLRSRYRHVHGQALPADTLVGLCMPRSADLLIGLLGILKAGAAYVPLDPDYPAARLEAVCQDSRLQWVVGDAEALAHSGLTVPNVLTLDEPFTATDEPLPVIDPAQLAYVIYTSGSTGTPKGAMLSHGNVLRLFSSSRRLFDFRQQDTWCLFHSYAFDFSVWEIWGALLHAARLLIVPQDISRDPQALRALLLEQQVTVLNQTPGAFARLISEDCRHAQRLPLREVIFGGEALQVASLAPWFDKYADSVRLSNLYGITETTVHVTHKQVTSADLLRSTRNDIGRPLADLQVLVLDQHGCLCPVGVTGQLHVAGPGLARGYLNQPMLTARAFVQWQGLRLYRTGDLGRWLDNGHLEYLGRNDHQVKIRGFRIELGDIQAALLRHAAIRTAQVRHDPGRELLQAWYCADTPLPPAEVHAHLRSLLPAFMVPQRLLQVQALPLTRNGKVDIAALQALDSSAPMTSEAWRAPAGVTQLLLAEIWRDVLELANPGADDDFFACGGDSLRVLDVQRLVLEAGFTFTPRQLFEHPTLAGLAARLEPLGEAATSTPVAAFSQVDPTRAEHCRRLGDLDAYPLTALQEGMLFHSQLDPGASTYLDIMSCRVQGEFDEGHFSAVLTALMQQHAVLRTLFARDAQGSWQRVRASLPLPLAVHDLGALSVLGQEQLLQQFFEAQLLTPLDGERTPLWRMTVHRLGEAFHLTLTCHHAILDGWSVATLFTTLLKGYDLALQGHSPQLLPPERTFADYVVQERRWRQDPALGLFWEQACADLEPTLLAAPGVGNNGPIARLEVAIDTSLDTALRSTAQQLGVSLDLLLLAAHLQALSLFSGRRQVVCGMPSHGRLIEDSGQRMLGLFLNTVPCSLTLQSDDSPQQLVQRLRELKAALDGCANYPLRDIQRGLGTGALFDSLFNFVNFRVFGQLGGLQRLSVQPGYCYEETNFTLVNQTAIDPHSGALRVELVHRVAALGERSVERFALFFKQALRDIAQVSATATERSRLNKLYPPKQWAGLPNASFEPVGIVQRFATVCAQGPQRIAISAGGQRLSYAELDRWSTALARQMLTQHGGDLDGQMIGVFALRSMATIASLLAVLKVGASYIPLDAAYPPRRLQQLLDDARPALVLGDELTLARHPGLNVPSLVPGSLPSVHATQAAVPLPSAEQLAYVMYTSGSTGEPKGVMVEQSAILRLVRDTNYVQIQPGDVLAQLASLSFDAATFELWGALLNGATLALAPPDSLLDSPRLEAFLLGEQVDVLFMTTRLFDQHVSAGHGAMFRNLRYLLVGGEVMDPGCMAQVLNCPQGRPQHLYNCYGPTENTTFSTMHRIDSDSLALAETPIGWPISDTQLYVLDEMQRPVPIGQVGELYLGGRGLARGYLGDTARTASAFVELNGHRLYRTGDAVRWLARGELAFVGRIDRTVKVNGYRVNLGELENAARLCVGVAQCVALHRQGLSLYYSGEVGADELRLTLAEHLPTFMLPTRLIALDNFPLNRNGKIDLARLPDPVGVAANEPVPISEPSQRRLFDLWQRLLGHGQIGPQDNFFERGGDSLLAMQLQQGIAQAFERELAIADVFRYPTLESMARYLDNSAEPHTDAQADNQRRVAALKARRAGLQRQ